MKPPIKDPLNKGHKNVKSFQQGTVHSLPKFTQTIVSTTLIKDNLSIKDNCFDFLLAPKCPLFKGSFSLDLEQASM